MYKGPKDKKKDTAKPQSNLSDTPKTPAPNMQQQEATYAESDLGPASVMPGAFPPYPTSHTAPTTPYENGHFHYHYAGAAVPVMVMNGAGYFAPPPVYTPMEQRVPDATSIIPPPPALPPMLLRDEDIEMTQVVAPTNGDTSHLPYTPNTTSMVQGMPRLAITNGEHTPADDVDMSAALDGKRPKKGREKSRERKEKKRRRSSYSDDEAEKPSSRRSSSSHHKDKDRSQSKKDKKKRKRENGEDVDKHEVRSHKRHTSATSNALIPFLPSILTSNSSKKKKEKKSHKHKKDKHRPKLLTAPPILKLLEAPPPPSPTAEERQLAVVKKVNDEIPDRSAAAVFLMSIQSGEELSIRDYIDRHKDKCKVRAIEDGRKYSRNTLGAKRLCELLKFVRNDRGDIVVLL